MFCYQCQETAGGKGCKVVGVCGKSEELASALDCLVFEVMELAAINDRLRKSDLEDVETSRLITDSLFSTITNANFDVEAIKCKLAKVKSKKQNLVSKAKSKGLYLDDLKLSKGEPSPERTSVLAEKNEDIRSLKQLIIYGAKGMAAYLKHAQRLGFEDMVVYAALENALSEVRRGDISQEELVSLTLGTGEAGVKAMYLLDKANTSTFGNPEMTTVDIGVGNRPGILISGHDLMDLKELLEQSADSGVDVYTHSEMLPAHYYPYFKKYKHFRGNYGNAWWRQKEEFETFHGPVLFTSNCIVPPRATASYKDRIYTTGSCGFPGAKHISQDPVTKVKDFSQLINHAKTCPPPEKIEEGTIVGGFAHNQVLMLKDKILAAIEKGDVKRFVVMAGCDGRMASRSYYSDFAKALGADSIILTAGCAKYRYNKLPLKPNKEFPRVLDAGQCNDSYSLVVIADELRKALGLKSINELPIVYNIAWYEQKAVIVLLALLSLGVKNIHLGPTLPAFLSPNVLGVLQKEFNMGGISTVNEDIVKFLNV